MNRSEYVLAVLAASDGAPHTPVQVQKLFFLLDNKIPSFIGGPRFDFHADNYGPFDKNVYNELDLLELRGLAEINPVADMRRKVYRTSQQGQQLGLALLNGLRGDVVQYIRQLSQWVRGLSFAQLVSAIYAEYPAMKANSIFQTY